MIVFKEAIAMTMTMTMTMTKRMTMSKKTANSKTSTKADGRWAKALLTAGLAAALYCVPLNNVTLSPLNAAELPKDTVNSVMWESMAKRYLLNDKAANGTIVMDQQILVHTPKIAEDQMNIPVHVDARTIKDVKKIVLIADLNPLPKVMTYEPENAEPRFSVRIKVEQGTPVRAAVLDGKGVWHVGATYVDAAGGGCSQPAVAYGTDNWTKTFAEVRARVWRRTAEPAATMRVTIKHPMDTGLADGIPAFFISELDLKASGGENLGRLYIHEPVSENPTLTLYPRLKAATSSISIKGRDNEGNLIKVDVPAPLESSALPENK